MRFFDTNVLYTNLGGTYDQSSGYANLAFDEDDQWAWTSISEDSDATTSYISRTLASSADINRIFIQNTNITNLTIYLDVGSGWEEISTLTTVTEIESADSTSFLYELAATQTIDAIKVTGSTTSTANSEKQIEQVLAFEELGQIEACDDVSPTKNKLQVISKLLAGKVHIIEKGTYYDFKLKFKAHYNGSTENALIQTLRDRSDPVWLWLNDDGEDDIRYSQEPFGFGDIYKVALQGKEKIGFADNYWRSGIDTTLSYVEVA